MKSTAMRSTENSQIMRTIQTVTILLALSSGTMAFTASPVSMISASEGSRTRIHDSSITARSARTETSRLTTSIWSSRNRPGSVSTQLSFRDGDEEESAARRAENKESTKKLRLKVSNWWDSLLFSNQQSKEDQQQQVVDEYLEFLDKRYHRLHDEIKQKKQKKSGRGVSAWDWLRNDNGEDQEKQIAPQPLELNTHQDDALYVLGVAELASERLLQKHRILTPTTPKSKSVVIETSAELVTECEEPKVASQGLFGKIAGPGSCVLDRIRSKERVFQMYKRVLRTNTIRSRIKSIMTAPLQVVLFIRDLWRTNDSKNTAALTVAALSATFFVVRPFLGGLSSAMFKVGLSVAKV